MKKIVYFALSLALLSSCSKVSGFDTPDVQQLEKQQQEKANAFNGTRITYAQLRAKVTPSFTQYIDNDAFEGYVISSDEAGNFYKKVYVQAPDKSGTIAVAIDKKGLYGEYPVGTKVQVRLKGTTVWYSGRYSTLEVVYQEVLVSTGEKIGIDQLATTFDNLNFDKQAQNNKLLILNGVSFENTAVGKTFHISTNQYNTTYNLTDGAGGTLPFLTSSFAAYIKDIVPSGRLRITGVLTRYGSSPQFYINSVNDIQKIN